MDTKFHRYPDFNQMLAICRRNLTKLEYRVCIQSFPVFFKIFTEKGHINDDVFKRIVFNQDCNIKGDIVRRTATISQKYMQMAKCLTHRHQITLQLNRIS